MEITYTKVGDYLIPDLTLPPENEQRPIGVWGCGCPVDTSAKGRSTDRAGRRDRRHRDYLIENKKAVYSLMRTRNTLHSYLADINEQAEDMFLRLVKELAEKEGITETLKAESQMLWVQRMNNIRSRATEIVNSELIYI